MKPIFSIIAVLAFVLCLYGQGQTPEPPVLKLTVGDYDRIYKSFKDTSENATNPQHWKDVTLKHKETGKTVKFEDLPAYERSVFYFLACEKITKELHSLDGAWKKNLDKADQGVQNNDNKKIANKADVSYYLGQLHQLRKDNALRYENQAESLFKDYPHHFTKEEREMVLSNIRSWHNKEKLIERK